MEPTRAARALQGLLEGSQGISAINRELLDFKPSLLEGARALCGPLMEATQGDLLVEVLPEPLAVSSATEPYIGAVEGIEVLVAGEFLTGANAVLVVRQSTTRRWNNLTRVRGQ